jgi:hypothetical protein
MKNKRRLFATSFIAGAATALYASKQMNKHNSTLSATDNNSYEANSNTLNNTTNQTAAETNNFFSKAPNIGTNHNNANAPITPKTQIPNTIYFENILDSNSVGSTFSNADESNITTSATIKIDSW